MLTVQLGARLRLRRGRVLPVAAAFLGAAIAGSASAADSVVAPDRYLSYGLTYLQPGSRPVDYGIGFDLAYAGRLAPGRWLEGSIFTSVLESGQSTAPDFYRSGLGLDLLQSFGDETRTHLYALAGGGVALNDVTPDTEDGTSYYLDAGVGVRGATWENWGLRPRIELRYLHDSVADGTDDFVFGITLEIPPKRQKIVEKVVEVEKIVEVPVEVEKIVEKETVCVVPPVQQEAPAAVAPAQPPADTDGDGVPDAQDKCPNTLAGAKVDANGCVQEEQKISLPNIEFESGSTVLAPGGKEKLESVVSFLQNQAEVQVDVFGHTDSQGRDAFNLKLSEGRARSVMYYLVSRGIAADRLSAKGFGETQPIASNETAEGRAQNRRVELLLRTKKK